MTHEFTPEELLGLLNEVEKRRSPKTLYVAGDKSLFEIHPRVSVVGSRKASPDGLKRAAKISRLLVERGAVVVSGLAEGIDAAAHKAAIEAGGKTIGVIGTPLDRSYPKSNAVLQQLMMQEHAVVSQFPSGYPTMPKSFPIRNATMALIVSASVIVEAGESSGALSQGWEALRLGRMLFIMESVVNNQSLKWPKEMLGYGAQVLANDNFEAFIEALPSGDLSLDALFA
ncbi:MAG: DNA-processing protein DprA [Bryobacteraceae bacterium]|nr:DNA-processing protein DprA [Bryobacteraceae bacterium]